MLSTLNSQLSTPSDPVKIAATVPVTLAAILFSTGCRTRPAPVPPAAVAPAVVPDLSGRLDPSPRLIVGRILAVDPAQGFAFVDLGADAPAAALVNGTELVARTLDLSETGRLVASSHLRGRTLGTRIAGGRPQVGDEVVWLAP
jgi:hypothetical protein